MVTEQSQKQKSPSRLELINSVDRFVVKIGSSILSSRERGLDHGRIEQLAFQIADIKKKGKEVILVSSGAIASGMKIMGKKKSSGSIALKQAAAAAGQSRLMWSYEKSFSLLGERVAQILLTRDDLFDRKRFLNSRNTLAVLLEYGIIPIINENDTVAVDEIRFGDNDTLAGLVTQLVDGQMLLILSDVDGLYNADPGENSSATLIPLVKEVSPDIEKLATGSRTLEGAGGMRSKLKTAQKVAEWGVSTLIVNGKAEQILERVFKGEELGTLILPKADRDPGRKIWIAHSLKIKGKVSLDEGATKALIQEGQSLFPSGVLEVSGEFGVGDSVVCLDPEGREFAKGLVNYSSRDIEKIRGSRASEIEGILGFKDFDEIISANNLMLLDE